MADGHRPGLQLAVEEDRLEEGVLRSVQAATIGVVVQDDVAFAQGVEVDFLEAALHQDGNAADHRRAEIRHRDEVAFLVRQAAGEVQGLVEDGRIGGLLQGDTHFPADGDHRRVEYAHRYHVHQLFSSAAVISR